MKKHKADSNNRVAHSLSRRDMMKSAGALTLAGMFPGASMVPSGAAATLKADVSPDPGPSKTNGFLYQPSKGRFWDPSVIYANDQYYMYTMYMPEGSIPGPSNSGRAWLATSKDGVHWKDYGVVLIEQGFRNNTVWKQYVAKVGDRYILNHGAFSDRGFSEAGGGNNLLRFYESKDLIHWTYLYEIPIDTRFYDAKGRWDHMWMMPKNQANPAEGYVGYMVADPIGHGGFGMMESPDGIHYHPIESPEITADFQIRTMEVGGVKKFGEKYYALGGNVAHYGFFGYGVYTYVADSPMGPFHPDLEAYRLTGTSGMEGAYYIDILSAFVEGSPEPLLSTPFSFGFRGIPGSDGQGVWFLPMRKVVVDSQGHLRPTYWEQNDLAKGSRVAVDPLQNTVVFPPGQTDSNPIIRVAATSDSVLVHTDNIGRRSLGPPGSFRKGVVVLNKRFDLEKGLIVEGRIQARSLTNRLQNWRQTCAGIYIEGTGTGPGTAILLEVGDPQWRKSHIGRLRLDTDFHFESLDITGSNCATVNGLDDAKEHTFRLWMRGGLMELYVDDLLMQSFFYYSPSGRIGFISQESEAHFSKLKFYEMNFADQE